METHSHFLFLVRPGRRTKRVFWKLLNERDPPTLNTIAKIRLPPSLTNLTNSQRLVEGGNAPLEPELFARSWSNASAKMKGSLTLFLKQKMDFNWSCKALVLNFEVAGLNLACSQLFKWHLELESRFFHNLQIMRRTKYRKLRHIYEASTSLNSKSLGQKTSIYYNQLSSSIWNAY